MQEIRKPPTPPSNRHGGRKPPRPTRAEIAAMLEEEMDEAEEKLRPMAKEDEQEWF